MARGGQSGRVRSAVNNSEGAVPEPEQSQAPSAATSSAESRPSVAFGAALILVAAFFLIFAKDVPRRGLAGDTDPGPRALPMALAIFLAAGGCVEVCRATVYARRKPATSNLPPTPSAAEAATTTVARTNFAILTAAVFSYVVALSWLGFQVSTLVFASSLLVWLGARWWTAVLSGLLLVIVVRVLFVSLFHVQLPAGVFGLNF